MRSWKTLLVTLFLSLSAAETVTANTAAFFGPDKSVIEALVSGIDSATTEIRIEAPIITAKPIQQAIIRAAQRGVKVMLILDQSAHPNEEYTTADLFSDWNVETYLFRPMFLNTNAIIIDSTIVLAGTYDFVGVSESTKSTTLVRISDNPQLARQFIDNFETHLRQSHRLLPKRLRALIAKEETSSAAPSAPQTEPKPAPESVKEKKAEKITFVGNIHSQVFHKSTCPSQAKIMSDNRDESATRDKFVNAGYKPCGRCRP